MHAYRMHELIKQRGKDTVVNISQRNSVYQTIERLLRTALIRIVETTQQEGRPERVVYQMTELGRETLREWVLGMIADPIAEFPEFPAALATIAVLPQAEATARLAQRVRALEQELIAAGAAMEQAIAMNIPRLFLIEYEYKCAIKRTEIQWINSLIDDFISGAITWDAEWLRQVALAFAAKSGSPPT